jgi:hypothetical protein
MSLSAESSTTDLGLLSCGLFEDELEELMQTHSPKVRVVVECMPLLHAACCCCTP